MKKRRIVIASILKPVDDTRMFEKMAMSLADSGRYEVCIIGYPSTHITDYANIKIFSLKPFRRISFGRLLAPLKVHRIIRQVKPELLIVNSHDLLIVAIRNRILFGTRIVYDIRENYYRNILLTDAFPAIFRPILAGWVRFKEKISAPFFRQFFLAERAYAKEMNFFDGRAIIIENKAKINGNLTRTPVAGKVRLLFSGTLAESTGVFLAIELTTKLHVLNPGIELHIIGYCAQATVLNRIRAAIANAPFITLTGGNQLVPHPEIVQAIYASDFGIVCYPPSRHTENSVPTKLYEYLAARLPILLQQHPPWVEMCSPYQACIPFDIPTANPQYVLDQMKSAFYTKSPESVTWEAEGVALVGAIDNIFA